MFWPVRNPDCAAHRNAQVSPTSFVSPKRLAGSEDAIWDELAGYFRSWISERDQED